MDAFASNYADTALAALSVTGLTEYIKALLEENETLRQVWVVGEVSSANPHTSGLFFSLQDAAGSATLQCVVWRNQLAKLASLPKVGEQVTALGSIRLYPQRGSYRLTVWQILPTGDGLRTLGYRQLRQQLTAEGIFDPERKRPLPPYPQVLAVVTSPQAAAWGDIQRTLRQHHPGISVLFSPATVQGDQAPLSIVGAIQRVVTDGRADVLLLSRGGGSAEDLECFNDERVVRAIAACPIPVVTGIGHQRDESLADLAADVCAHTPTAAIAAAVPALETLMAAHHNRYLQVLGLTQARVSWAEQQRLGLEQRLQRLRLDRQIQQEQSHLRQLKQRLGQAIQFRLRSVEDRCTALQEQLGSLDPEAVLQRGYALVRQKRNGQDEIVTQAHQLVLGEALSIHFAQGQAIAEVVDIIPDSEHF